MKSSRSSFPAAVEVLEARIAPAFVLDTVITAVKLPDTVVPGDMGSVTFTVTNSGDTEFSPDGGIFSPPGGIHVDFAVNASGSGAVLSGPEFEDSMPHIAAGKTVKITKAFKIPALDLASPDLPEGSIVVRVDVAADAQYAYSDARPYLFQFGSVGARKGVGLAAVETDTEGGTKVKFMLAGKGTGDLNIGGGAVNLSFTGTDETSSASLTGTGGDGFIQLHEISSAARMNKIVMPRADADGNLNFPLGFKLGMQLHDIGGVANDVALAIGTTAESKPVNLVFNRVADVDFNIAPGVGALKVGEWLDLNANADVLTTKSIGTILTVPVAANGTSGNFSADLVVSPGNEKGIGMNSAKIVGKLENAIWTFGGPSTSVSGGVITAGDTKNWRVSATGPIASIKLDSLDDSMLGSTAAIEAQFFGDIAVAGDLRATIIRANGADAKGYGIDDFVARNVLKLDQFAVPNGGIDRIGVQTWDTGGTASAIDARFLGTFLLGGGDDDEQAITPAVTLTAAAADLPKAVKGSITKTLLLGTVTGTWTVAADVLDFQARQTGSTFKLIGDAAATTVELMKTRLHLEGTVDVADIKLLEVSTYLAATITTHTAGTSIGKIDSRDIDTATINAPGTIGAIIASSYWKSVTVTAANVGLIRAGDDGALGRAAMNSVTFNVNGGGTTDFLAGGTLTNVQFNLAASHLIKGLHAKSWNGGGISGGVLQTAIITDGIDGATFTLGAGLESFSAGGKVLNATFTINGDAGTLAVGALESSTITVNGDLEGFVVRGLKTDGRYFTMSNLTANAVGSLLVRNVDSSQAASTISLDSVKTYKRFEGKTVAKALDDRFAAQPAADQAGFYVVNIR